MTEKSCSALRTVLMVDSVEAITPNPTRKPLLRPRVNGGSIRQLAVKAGVKYGDLRNRAYLFLNSLYALQFRTIMKRSEGRLFATADLTCGVMRVGCLNCWPPWTTR